MTGTTLKQLKSLSKKYKLPVSGTKKQLTMRLKKNVKLSKKDKQSLKRVKRIKRIKSKNKKRIKSGMFGFSYLGFGSPTQINPSNPSNPSSPTEPLLPFNKYVENPPTYISTDADLSSIVNPDATGSIMKTQEERFQWEIDKSIEIMIPRIKEVAERFFFQGDVEKIIPLHEYETKIHLFIDSKLESDVYIPYLVLTLSEAQTLNTESFNKLFSRSGKFIDKIHTRVIHSDSVFEHEEELFPENAFSETMKEEFNDLYSWERRFGVGGDAVDRTSMFRLNQIFAPQFKNIDQEGIRTQPYDVYVKEFV